MFTISYMTGRFRTQNVKASKEKKKVPVVEEDPDVEIITKTEYIYEDTKCITGVEPEYQWGDIYRLITRREVLDIVLRKKK